MRASDPDTFAPRSLPVRPLIAARLHPQEVHLLVKALESEACRLADQGDDLAADILFRRVAKLREAVR